jgi:predicted esterase
MQDAGELRGKQILASAGAADEILPPGVFAAGVGLLRRLGATVEARVYPGLGHGLALADARELRAWLGGLGVAETAEAAPAKAACLA